MIDTPRRALAVTAVLAVVFVASAVALGWPGQDPGATSVARDVALLAINTVPLLLLHRHPLVVALVLGVAYPLWLLTGHEAHMLQSLPSLVTLYAVGGWARPLWLRAAGLLLPVWMMAAVFTGWWSDAGVQEVGYIAVMFGLGWAAGVVVAARRAYIQELEARTAALTAARQELAERAVADERARIARELHDVIAHAMSVITVRAGVGAHLLPTRPAAAAEALGVIERTGREALVEMRRLLAVLREPHPNEAAPDATAPPAAPQPGLVDLPRLACQMGSAGVAVSLTTEGNPAPLPAGLDLTAYRVVQEALTNVAKHARDSRATVTVRHGDDALELEVRNPGPVNSPVRPGQGLLGMAERVALYGGQLETGPDREGFRVWARFPREELLPVAEPA
jgi:signal transduction histidine kinase